MTDAADIVKAEKVAAVKRLREKANGYRKTASDNRELAGTMVTRADSLELLAKQVDLGADALELEVTGNW